MPHSKEARQREYDKAGEIIERAKSVPCKDCNGVFPTYVMDFNHVRGVKLFNIGATRHRGLAKLIAEIAKCDVVCSNCHRIRTHSKTAIHLMGR